MNKLKFLFLFSGFITGLMAQQPFRCGTVFVDPRDGQKYPTVLIGNQCWMAKNINTGKQVQYTAQRNNGIIEKTCYQNLKANCDTFGGLYTWGEAVQYDSGSSKKIQGVCPAGWHVPTVEEWRELYKTAGHAQALKVTKENIPAWDGNNTTGFSALPGGLAYDNVFGRKGDWAIFWTATSVNPEYAWSVEMDNYYLHLGTYTDVVITNTYLTLNAFSIRCIKD